MGRVKDWAGQIREDDRRREDDNQYGHTTYLEAMYEVQRQRENNQRKPKQQK